MKTFNTTNLVNHLKARHSKEFQKFLKIKKDKETQQEVAKSDRMQGRSTQLGGLCQLTLHAAGQKNSHVLGINDPRALHIHRKIGDTIAVNNQPFSVVEDIGFINLLHSRYIIPNRKYYSETVVPNIFPGVCDGINMKLCDISSFSFTTDICTINISSDSLLSLQHTGLQMISKNCQQFKYEIACRKSYRSTFL